MGGELTRFTEGHSASRKYTPEIALEIFREVLDYIKKNEKVCLLSQALNANDYYVMLPNYLLRAFPDVPELKELYLKIMSLLEERVTWGAMNGTLKEATSIFVLKTTHGKVERAPQQEAAPSRQGIDWSKVPVEKMEEIKRILLEAQNNAEPGNKNNEGWLEAENG